jgi:crotonobetainyl-CoA:carnitine CoA-transferase CaiB-like acyl-CoA transferase
MSDQQDSEGLLSGFRVLDLTDEKGLLCGKILGDMGADVIKIERPGGDPARNVGPFYKDIPHPEKSLFWFFTNTSKRGITLNLESSAGRDIFQRLVKTAHFVIESFDPGYMSDLELGYADLEKINPALVMTSITPFGQTGPHAHYKASDLVLWNMGGMAYLCGDPDRAPVRVSAPQAYFHGSLHGALGSMVAHYHRELTGEGQHVDVSIQDAVIFTTMNAVETWDLNRVNITPCGPFHVAGRPASLGPLFNRGLWPCKDGHVTLYLRGGAQAGLVNSSRELVKMANEEGLALELQDYDWYKHDRGKISQEQEDFVAGHIDSYFRTKNKADLFDEAVKRDIILTPASNAKDLLESPQLAARGYWTEVAHPELGEAVVYPGAPVKLSDAPWKIQCRAPLIGEHNDEIYCGELGFSKEDVVLLKTDGTI